MAKKVRLSKTDRHVLEGLVRIKHRELMGHFTREAELQDEHRELRLRHLEEQLRPLEHAANSLGFGPL